MLLFFLCFGFFGPEACGILAPRPGIEPTVPALEGEVLTTGPPGKSPGSDLTGLHFRVSHECPADAHTGGPGFTRGVATPPV